MIVIVVVILVYVSILLARAVLRGVWETLTVTCPNCQTVDDDVYPAPSCDVTTHECERCGFWVNVATPY